MPCNTALASSSSECLLLVIARDTTCAFRARVVCTRMAQHQRVQMSNEVQVSLLKTFSNQKQHLYQQAVALTSVRHISSAMMQPKKMLKAARAYANLSGSESSKAAAPTNLSNTECGRVTVQFNWQGQHSVTAFWCGKRREMLSSLAASRPPGMQGKAQPSCRPYTRYEHTSRRYL